MLTRVLTIHDLTRWKFKKVSSHTATLCGAGCAPYRIGEVRRSIPLAEEDWRAAGGIKGRARSYGETLSYVVVAHTLR